MFGIIKGYEENPTSVDSIDYCFFYLHQMLYFPSDLIRTTGLSIMFLLQRTTKLWLFQVLEELLKLPENTECAIAKPKVPDGLV
ncbi:hypothetical protein Tco_1076132 [Tanacetum coccineum]